MYVPGVVPGFVGGGGDGVTLLAPPHATRVPKTVKTKRKAAASRRLRQSIKPNKKKQATSAQVAAERASCPSIKRQFREGKEGKKVALEEGAVELTVMAAVTVAVPAMFNGLEATAQVGGSTAPGGVEVSAQER